MQSIPIPYYDAFQGARYLSDPYLGVRLLLVGESSFKRNAEHAILPDHLQSNTERLISGKEEAPYSKFWRFIQRSVTGEHEIDNANQASFWNGVSLVNLVQRPMTDEKSRPLAADYLEGSRALVTYIAQLKPHGVIIYSKTSWKSVKSELSLRVTSDNIPDNTLLSAQELAESNIHWRSEALGTESPFFLLLSHPSARPKLAGTVCHEIISPFVEVLRRSLI